MSSNIRLKKVCQHCGNLFTAKTTVTKFCSDDCAKKNYKKRKREEGIQVSNRATAKEITRRAEKEPEANVLVEPITKSLIDLEELSAITGLSRRTLFRLMENRRFPRLKIGNRLLFKKDDVINYLTIKFESK
jgi:excisionase family DNA binding protein